MSVDWKVEVHLVSIHARLGAALNSHLLASSTRARFVGWVTVVVQVLTFTAHVFSLAELLDLLRGGRASPVNVRSRVSILGRHCYVGRHDLRVNSAIVVSRLLLQVVSLLSSHLLLILIVLRPSLGSALE